MKEVTGEAKKRRIWPKSRQFGEGEKKKIISQGGRRNTGDGQQRGGSGEGFKWNSAGWRWTEGDTGDTRLEVTPPCSSQALGAAISLADTYRGDIRVGGGHFHQVDEVWLVLPGGVVVIDVQQRDVHLWESKGAELLQGARVPEVWDVPWVDPRRVSGCGRVTIPQGI